MPPYRVAPLDALVIQVSNAFPMAPINNLYVVDPDGTVNFGPPYKARQVSVVGKTLPEAKTAIEDALKQDIVKPEVDVALGQSHALQQIPGRASRAAGRYGRPGACGDVSVVGKTLPKARAAIEAQLSRYLQNPEVTVDVYAYNGKVFYMIFNGGGSGRQSARLPSTGNETVLDAVIESTGCRRWPTSARISVAGPVPTCSLDDQIYP